MKVNTEATGDTPVMNRHYDQYLTANLLGMKSVFPSLKTTFDAKLLSQYFDRFTHFMYFSAEADPENYQTDVRTALAYAELYGKVLGVDSNYRINQIKMKLKPG
jgi:hypothetical protein